MTTANIERRLRKVETARRPPRGVFFVAWGATPEEIERGIEEARKAGTVATSELVVRAPWPFGTALPPNRWTRDEVSHFTHTEFSALIGPVDELCDRLAEGVRAELAERGIDPDELLQADVPERWQESARQETDAVLLRTVLAEPLDQEPAPMPAARLQRIVDCILALGMRARIRGSYAERDELLEAAHASRH